MKTRILKTLAVVAMAGGTAQAAPIDAQTAAIDELRARSRTAPEVKMRSGLPRTLRLDVEAPGADAVRQAEAFVAQHDVAFQAGRPDLALVTRRASPGEGGATLVSFAQTWRGLPVFASALDVEVWPARGHGRVRLVHGAVSNGVDLDGAPPRLTAAQAESVATAEAERVPAPVVGDTTLMVYDPRLVGEEGAARLVWRVRTGGPHAREVLVDARTGAVVLAYGLGHDLTDAELLADFDLKMMDVKGLSMEITDCFEESATEVFIGDETGLVPPYDTATDPAYAWHHLRNTWLYFRKELGRHSFDDDDGQVVAYVNAGFDVNGTFLAGCGIEFGYGWVDLDVAAHEFTHAVISETSNLLYLNQSGALNESFADVMAALVDGDWLIAEDRTEKPSPPIRSLAEPPKYGQPDTAGGYVTTMADNGGVHTNSGIPNKVAYLIADGGTFQGVTVQGIGRGKLKWLTYHLLRFLAPGAQFADARDLAVSTAETWAEDGTHLFTAYDACQVRQAWHAVAPILGGGDADCDGVEDDEQDDDADLVANAWDNCLHTPNDDQADADGDGVGDACDCDADGSGVHDYLETCGGSCAPPPLADLDGDGTADVCDPDDDGDGVLDVEDNCDAEPNPDQLDANGDGEGDACNPDFDGDVHAGKDDNCAFEANVDQLDSDGDGLGDACDLCPLLADWDGAYTFPLEGQDPKPLQPDSDGDGTPDACDPSAFDRTAVFIDGSFFHPLNPPKADGSGHEVVLQGAGAARLPLALCDGELSLSPNERVELTLTGGPLDARILDDLGTVVARLGGDGDVRGLRFKPDCARRYFVELRAGGEGAEATLTLDHPEVDPAHDPWSSDIGVVPPRR